MHNPIGNLVDIIKTAPIPYIAASSMVAIVATGIAVGIEGYVSGNSITTAACLVPIAIAERGYQSVRKEVGKLVKESGQVQKSLEEFGWDDSALAGHTDSWCQRRAILQGATNAGYKTEAKAYLKDQGHKWYHILPEKSLFRKVGKTIMQFIDDDSDFVACPVLISRQ
jgi:hypothetical protein